MTRQSIGSRGMRAGMSVRLLDHSGSPWTRGASDDNTLFVIASRTGWTTQKSIVSRRMRTGLSVRLLRASRSPRTRGARDDKSGCGGSVVRLVRAIGSPRASSSR